jgi:hypothetical protein
LSATVIVVFILVSSAVLLTLFLRLACQVIVGRQFDKDYNAKLTESIGAEYRALRGLLRENPGEVPDCDEALEALGRDYKAVTYLLRKTATNHPGRYSHAERLLILDFQLLRLWVRLRGYLSVHGWRSSLVRMATILEYFGNVTGQRHGSSLDMFEPPFALARNPALPLLTMCSYCKNVRSPSEGSAGEWVTPTKYAQVGGHLSVVLNHGVCSECHENFVKPMLARSKTAAA